MPLLLTDFPPHARPKPLREPTIHGRRYVTTQAQDPGIKARLRELEAALVTMLTLLERYPDQPQPLSGYWWHGIVSELGWERIRFSEAIHMLRGGSFIGWGTFPEGLTRRGIREAMLLRKEGVEPWAPPDSEGEQPATLHLDFGKDEAIGVVTSVNPDGTVTVLGSGISRNMSIAVRSYVRDSRSRRISRRS